MVFFMSALIAAEGVFGCFVRRKVDGMRGACGVVSAAS